MILSHRLLLGVAREDITPKIGSRIFGYNPHHISEAIHDRLTASAFAFECGGERAMLITVSVCELDTGLNAGLRGEIGKKHDLNPDSIIIAATHTHSGPATVDMTGWGGVDMEYFDEIFRPAVLSAADAAFSGLRPVTMGVGVGDSLVGVNRRELKPDNRVVLGQCPWGCFNPKMTVLSFKDESGSVVAAIVHYGAHGTAAGITPFISRDWPGLMTDALDAVTGGISAFFNGPEGDVGPRLSNGLTVGNMSYVEELGRIAAQDAVRIFNTITDYRDVDIASVSAEVSLPLQPLIPYETAAARCEELSGQTINIGRQMLEYFRTVKSAHESGYQEEPSRSFTQTAVRIGNIAFVSFPYELFSEIGLRVAQELPALHVLSLSNANGAMGYFPTHDQLCRVGYEIECFLYNQVQAYTEDADYRLMRETLRTLALLKK